MPIWLSNSPSRVSSRALRFNIVAEFANSDHLTKKIPAYKYLQSFSFDVTMGGAFNGTITLFDRYGTLFPVGAIVPGAADIFTMSWDWNNAQAGDPYPIYKCCSVQPTPAFARDGTTVNFEVVQQVAALPTLNKNNGPRSWSEGFTASEIVTSIAVHYGWKFLIEPSVEKLEAFTMGDETHLEFIKTKMTLRARNENGEPFGVNRGDGSFSSGAYFDVNDVFHFHSLRYAAQGRSDNQNGAVVAALNPAINGVPVLPATNWKFLYGADYSGDCMNFTPQDSSLIVAGGGGDDTTLISIDTFSKTFTETKSTIEGMLVAPFSNVSAGVRWAIDEAMATNTRYQAQTANNQDKAYIRIPARTDDEGIAMTINRQMCKRLLCMNAELEVVGTHRLNPGDFVQVRALDSRKYDIYTSGMYQIYSMNHAVDSSGWMTKYKLFRAANPQATAHNTDHTQIPVAPAVVGMPTISDLSIGDPKYLRLGPPRVQGGSQYH